MYRNQHVALLFWFRLCVLSFLEPNLLDFFSPIQVQELELLSELQV